jgi:hypothetical protein
VFLSERMNESDELDIDEEDTVKIASSWQDSARNAALITASKDENIEIKWYPKVSS